jgi:hypothetical protein
MATEKFFPIKFSPAQYYFQSLHHQVLSKIEIKEIEQH